VLNARPEDRRAIIEEAAGILKFRKRREKAQRRLEATEGNLLRLTDLLREVRRQLRPLERQADAARRYDGLVAELKAVQMHLVGREIETLRTREERRRGQRAELLQTEQDLQVRLRALDTDVLNAEKAIAIPGDDDVADVLTRAEALRERARGLTNLIAERGRGFDRELAAVADEGVVETLVAEASSLREELAAVDADFASLAPSRAEVEAAEHRVIELGAGLAPGDAEVRLRDSMRDLEQALARHRDLDRELAQTREQLATVARELYALSPEMDAAQRAEETAERLRVEVEADAQIAPDMNPEARARQAAEEALHAAQEQWRDADAEATRWRARAEALALALAAEHAAAGGEAIAGYDGVIGPLIDHVDIEPGAEVAVAAALGEALHAIVVEGDGRARAAIEQLKAGDGNALFLVVGSNGAGAQGVLAPPGTRPLGACVRGTRPGLDRVLARLLAPYVLVDSGWAAALDIALADPGVVAVTRGGDRFGGASPWRAGPPGTSAVTPGAHADAVAAAERAEAERAEIDEVVEGARQALAAARRAELLATERERLRRTELVRLTAEAASLRRTVEVRSASLEERQTTLRTRVEALQAEAAELPELLAALRTQVADSERSSTEVRSRRREHDRLRVQAAKLRQDFEVRGAAVEERRTILGRRLTAVEARLAARPDEEAQARARRAQVEHRRQLAVELGERLAERSRTIDALADRLRRRRQEQSEAARAAGRRLDGLRRERAEAEKQLAELRERANRLEIEETEIRLRLEQAIERVRHEFDCEPDAALAAPAPEVPEGITLPARARELERELRLMGPVNPLALSEYEALVERHEFLGQQLDDVKSSRRELTRVIKAVDAEIVSVFEGAFADVARNFSELFALLFPGGSGRLVLTEPHDMLNTGIEMEARPSGKMVRRLSLLSGGERSLAALAYLFAVFRARPSPFYLMDEVEAALDDVNLHRFLDLVHEFRTEAQLLVVSHQKRTMEAADVLYGVSMAPGGSSRVVSQRIHDLTLEDV
jgi:chromosome segregation protein